MRYSMLGGTGASAAALMPLRCNTVRWSLSLCAVLCALTPLQVRGRETTGVLWSRRHTRGEA